MFKVSNFKDICFGTLTNFMCFTNERLFLKVEPGLRIQECLHSVSTSFTGFEYRATAKQIYM